MKKIVIATDSFKDCMSGLDVAANIEYGFKNVFPECEYKLLAMADGGEGTVNSLVSSTNGELVTLRVKDPLGREIDSFLGYSNEREVAFIEMAAASGIEKLNPLERNPMQTSTYGTGQLLKHAIESGVKKIIIGIGGSATNDCGIGMASALGAKFLNADNQVLEPIAKNLGSIHSIDMSEFDNRILNVEIEIACDVKNQLLGENGATYIFGPQKGGSKQELDQLENGMRNFAKVLEMKFHEDPQQLIGGGAAGGLGVGLRFFCNGTLRRGVEIVCDYLRLEDHIKGADLVITGEGRFDSQSIRGKTPIGVSTLASKNDVECIVIAGSVEPGVEVAYEYGVKAVFSIMQKPQSLEEALSSARENIRQTSEAIARLLV